MYVRARTRVCDVCMHKTYVCLCVRARECNTCAYECMQNTIVYIRVSIYEHIHVLTHTYAGIGTSQNHAYNSSTLLQNRL
jgi:hypothetical protein